MNTAAKGRRTEHRARRVLEVAGYTVTRAAASHGCFDLVAIGPTDIRLIQVKSGGQYLSALEREAITALVVPGNCSREVWRFPDRCRAPLIERL
jgi:Holliday junction resolvase